MHIPKTKIIKHIIFRILQTCYFEYFGYAWPHQSKIVVPTYGKLMFTGMQKIKDIAKILQTFLGTLNMPGQTHLHQ